MKYLTIHETSLSSGQVIDTIQIEGRTDADLVQAAVEFARGKPTSDYDADLCLMSYDEGFEKAFKLLPHPTTLADLDSWLSALHEFARLTATCAVPAAAYDLTCVEQPLSVVETFDDGRHGAEEPTGDGRSFGAMATEHAEWLSACVSHAVGATRKEWGYTTPWLSDLKDALYQATRGAFLRGAWGTVLAGRILGNDELRKLATAQAYRADQWAWERLVTVARHTGHFAVTADSVHVLEHLLGILVKENCLEIFLHGADHARRKARESPAGAMKRFRRHLERRDHESAEAGRPRQFDRILGRAHAVVAKLRASKESPLDLPTCETCLGLILPACEACRTWSHGVDYSDSTSVCHRCCERHCHKQERVKQELEHYGLGEVKEAE